MLFREDIIVTDTSQFALLAGVFNAIFSRHLNGDEFEERVVLQKAIYLLRELGITCGDYSFSWNKRGPFSPELSDDVKNQTDDLSEKYVFSKVAEQGIARLRDVYSSGCRKYDSNKWFEAVASLHYMKLYMHPSYSEDKLAIKLMEYKPIFADIEENKRAFKALDSIFS